MKDSEASLRNNDDVSAYLPDSRIIHEINSTAETIKIIGISRGTLYRLMREGKIQSATLGSRRVFTRNQIESFIASLEGDK